MTKKRSLEKTFSPSSLEVFKILNDKTISGHFGELRHDIKEGVLAYTRYLKSAIEETCDGNQKNGIINFIRALKTQDVLMQQPEVLSNRHVLNYLLDTIKKGNAKIPSRAPILESMQQTLRAHGANVELPNTIERYTLEHYDSLNVAA